MSLYGHLTLKGTPVRALVDTGASVSCLGYETYVANQHHWGPLEKEPRNFLAAGGKSLDLVGRTSYLPIRWGEVEGFARFIVAKDLKDPDAILGMDLLVPLKVKIDIGKGTIHAAKPAPRLMWSLALPLNIFLPPSSN